MIFSWFRNRRRQKFLKIPMPETWLPVFQELNFFNSLNAADQADLIDITRILIEEKNWFPCLDLDLTDKIKIIIAAQAALLILRLDHDYYHRTSSIYVYPTDFYTPHPEDSEKQLHTLGLATSDGSVILSYTASHAGADNDRDGHNVVFHEFAHRLDMADNWVDGTPLLPDKETFNTWVRVMTEHYDQLKADFQSRRRTVLDPYGTQDPGEFFAVATEAFFEKPKQLHKKHTSLYRILQDFYRQDPANWHRPKNPTPPTR